MRCGIANPFGTPALAREREIAARHVPDWSGLEQRRIEVMARNREQIAARGRSSAGSA